MVYHTVYSCTHAYPLLQLLTLCDSDDALLAKLACYRSNPASLVPLKVRERERERRGGGE